MTADDDRAARREPKGFEGTFAEGLFGMLKDMAAEYAREDQGPALLPLGGVGRFEGEVFVDLKETRFGRPLRVTRDLLKRGDSGGLQVRDVERAAHLSARDVEKYLAQMVKAGYLTSPGAREECYECRGFECYHHDYRCWKLTAKGRTLGHASGRQPTTRKRADALVAKVVKAAAAINDDPALLWWVKEIRAAGAYADPQQDPLLHVDLAVVLRPLLDDPAEQLKAEVRLRDAAQDRNERVRAWDLNGYGHFQTRLALAGRSKVVRLFQSDHGGTQGKLLFHEDRDLTVTASPTPTYAAPAEPEPLQRCSWCRRAEPSERVAPRGEPVSQSPIGLCRLCSQLGRSDTQAFSWYQPRYWTLRATRAALLQQPHHAEGCALCGRPDASDRSWWTDREDGEQESAPVNLRLCSVCPGLLELADRPERERWWHWRYQDACVAGMHQMMREAVNLPTLAPKTVARKLPRLTDLHHTLLEEIRRRGVLSPLDMARSNSSQRHQDSQWWTVRFGHLLDNGLLAPLGPSAVRRRRITSSKWQAHLPRAEHLTDGQAAGRRLHQPVGRLIDAARPQPGPRLPVSRRHGRSTSALTVRTTRGRLWWRNGPDAPAGAGRMGVMRRERRRLRTARVRRDLPTVQEAAPTPTLLDRPRDHDEPPEYAVRHEPDCCAAVSSTRIMLGGTVLATRTHVDCPVWSAR